jgi:hypothetical protein
VDSGQINFEDPQNGFADILRLKEGGNVEVPNGILDMNSDDIRGIAGLNGDGGQEIQFAGGGDTDIIFEGSGGRVFYLRNNEGIQFDSNSNSEIQTTGTGSSSIKIVDSANSDQRIASFEEGGNVEIPNGNVDINGNRVVDGGGNGDDTVFIGDGNNDNVRLETGGEDVDVPDGQVDVNSPTNTGRTVDVGGGVNADGDLKTFSGNVASDQRMCIGDRCA